MDNIAVLLLGLGLLLVVLEIFFPSLGVLGFLAAASIIAGAVIAYKDESLTSYLTISFILLPLVAAFAFKVFPNTPMGKKLTLNGPTFSDSGRSAAEPGLNSLVGVTGKAETDLRPAGIATVQERRIDVVTRGGHITAGDLVEVIKVEGNRVIVKARDSSSPS